jgi:hypothetical protein
LPIFKVILPTGRAYPGSLSGYSSITGLREFGPIPVLGRGAHRDQSLENGDTPLGGYEILGIKAANTDTQGILQYGPNPRIKLRGTSGIAKIREAAAGGDAALRIHGGRQNAESRVLAATYGCLRAFDHDMIDLLRYLKASAASFPIPLEVSEGDTPEYSKLLVDLTTVDISKDSP